MNALPILLLGGAAVLMMSGKKKKSGAIVGGQIILPPTTPPPLSPAVKKSGSGYPGVSRDQMQEIQTMLMANGYGVGAKGLDGRYGPTTKQAVWEFQEDWGQGLVVDGKPGSKTRAALKQAEAGRLDALGSSGDECFPMDPGAWGAGNVCVFDGTRWVRQKAQVAAPPTGAAKPSSTLPSVSGFEVGFNETLTKYKMGVNWKTGVLDKWLNKQRLNGMLATAYADDGEVWEDKHPYEMSSGDVWQAAGEGMLLAVGAFGVYAGGWVALPMVIAGTTEMSVAAWVLWMGMSSGVVAGESSMLMNLWNGPRGRVIEGTAAEAFVKFTETHKVKVAGKMVPILALKQTPAVLELHKQILKYILRFQSSQFN